MSDAKIILEADFDTSHGWLGNLDEWQKHSGLVRAAILKGWLNDLMNEYDQACDDIYKEEI